MNKGINKMIDCAMTLDEAEELVTISEKLFEEKLSDLQTKMDHAVSQQEKNEVQLKAQRLHEDYKKSLQDIESFVHDVCATGKRSL